MQVILVEDVDKLGRTGDLVKVKPGYARNFLLPRGAAVFASEAALTMYERQKEKFEAEAQKKRDQAEAYKESLKAAERITITAKAGEAGKLFGSVTNKAIAGAILDQLKIEVDRHKIKLPEAINELGEFPIKVGLGSSVEADIVVVVEAE